MASLVTLSHNMRNLPSQTSVGLAVPMIRIRPSKFCMRSKTLYSSSKIPVQNIKMSKGVGQQHYPVGHTENLEVWKSLEGWMEENILPLLKPIEKSWQPQDFLPNPDSDGFYEQVKELRERSKELPDEYYVVLVGDMITEEALPTYQSRVTILDGIYDQTGVDSNPLAIWTRAWSAEENRHGDLLNKYLYLSGRVDMRQVEKTIQHLIGSGMELGSAETGTNTYNGMIYTSFQERATSIAHGNTAMLAKKHGDMKLAQICGTIAADEKRHETAYTKIVGKLFEVDPEGTVVALAASMKRKVQMPGQLMFDGRDARLFEHYSKVAHRIGVYTAMDYVEIMEHLVDKWNVDKLRGLSSDGLRAQDYVCSVPRRLRKLEERATTTTSSTTHHDMVPFSWIFDKHVQA